MPHVRRVVQGGDPPATVLLGGLSAARVPAPSGTPEAPLTPRGDGPSLPIDVRIPGVGRFKKRSGAHTRAERDDLVAMLRLLPRQGYLDVVRDVQAGRRQLLDVYAHYLAGTLAELRGPHEDQLLEPTLSEWLDTAQCADGTRRNRRDAFRALRSDARRAYRFRDLPTLLRAHRQRCELEDSPRAFNIAKTCVQAFVRDTVGRRVPLGLAVADVPSLRERRAGRAGLTVLEALEVRDQLATSAGRAWWSMCLTGMGPKEYWVDGWRVESDRVHIAGAKVVRHGLSGAYGRVRDVPLVDYPVRPEITRPGFCSALWRLSERRVRAALTDQLGRAPTAAESAAGRETFGGWRVSPYMARKTFARWMEDAGIPRVRREIYRGHGKRDVGDLYERYEVTAYLREDAKKMRDQLPRQGLRMVP